MLDNPNPIAPNATPDLTEIRPSNEGGFIGLYGLKYQYHFAAQKCLEMLAEPAMIECVACELQDDVVVKLRNGKYIFYQIKNSTGDLWTINELKQKNVWKNFVKCLREFGDGHSYVFVSDQHAKNRISKKSDLGRIKSLTDIGRESCNQSELIEADDLLNALMDNISDLTNKAEAEALFWSLRLLTGYDKITGLKHSNLNKLEEVLRKLGIDSDLPNRMRIYNCIVLKLETSVTEPLPEWTYREKVERRKIRPDDVRECLLGPYKDPQLAQFDLNADPAHRNLRQKTVDGKLPAHWAEYFIECRNYFHLHFKEDFVNAAFYLNELRRKVWDICIEQKMTATTQGSYSPLITYKLIRDGLKQLEDRESNHSPIPVDFDYLHGMLCQLTAECHHDWYPLE